MSSQLKDIVDRKACSLVPFCDASILGMRKEAAISETLLKNVLLTPRQDSPGIEEKEDISMLNPFRKRTPKSHPITSRKQRVEAIQLASELPKPKASVLKRWLQVIGPGVITGFADDDELGIGTYAQTGAQYGFKLLWTVLAMLPLMYVVQEMAARIGVVTGKGIAKNIKIHYSNALLYPLVFLLVIANTINLGADLGAMASGTQLLFPNASFPFVRRAVCRHHFSACHLRELQSVCKSIEMDLSLAPGVCHHRTHYSP